jgi:hypothetical protein
MDASPNLSDARLYVSLFVTVTGHCTVSAASDTGVVTELKNRGVEDVLIACVDGLKGFPRRSNQSSQERRYNCASSIC